MGDILKKETEHRARVERAKELQDFKRRMLQAQQASREEAAHAAYRAGSGQAALEDSEDDDLEVVDDNIKVAAREEAADRLKRAKPSAGMRQQLELAMGHQKAYSALHAHSPEKKSAKGRMSLQALQAAAAPSFSFGNARDDKAMGKKALKVDKSDLVKKLLADAAAQSQEVIRKKEQEWVKKGGTLKEGTTSEVRKLDEYVEKAVKAAQRREAMEEGREVDEDEDGDEDDGEWQPVERGSASPEPEDDDLSSEELQGDTTGDADDPADSTPSRPRAARRPAARPRAILDSDADSDAENTAPARPRPGRLPSDGSSSLDTPGRTFSPFTSQVPVALDLKHRASLSSFDDHTDAEDELGCETDKENVRGLMFDRGEDKENKAVVRLSPGERAAIGAEPGMTSRQGSGLFGIAEGMRNRLSMSPSGVEHVEPQDENDADGRRAPLKELVSPRAGDDDDDDNPFVDTPSKRPKTQRLRSPLPSLPPLFGGIKDARGGMSQFFDDEVDAAPAAGPVGSMDSSPPRPAVALQGAFSQMFGSGSVKETPKGVKFGGLADAFDETQARDPTDHLSYLDSCSRCVQAGGGFQNLRKDNDDISLTLDTKLQPALEPDATLLQKADLIFEKEQEYLLQAAQRAPPKKPQLYVTENGFVYSSFSMKTLP